MLFRKVIPKWVRIIQNDSALHCSGSPSGTTLMVTHHNVSHLEADTGPLYFDNVLCCLDIIIIPSYYKAITLTRG